MNSEWKDVPLQPLGPLGVAGWSRVVLRGALLGCVVVIGLVLTVILRVVERPLCGLKRPVTPYITMAVCRAAFAITGIGFKASGAPMASNGAVVANHGSWLDIFALNARKRIFFVSKAEVAGWPGIGWLARATGTVFITRDRRHAAEQKAVFEQRLMAGHKLLFFPEGTSTDTRRVLDFKPTLFAAFFEPALRETLQVQPVSVLYTAPKGKDPRYYGWWGDMDFADGLLRALATAPQGGVEVIYHSPLKVSDFANRKTLAAECQNQVRATLTAHISRQLADQE